MTPEHKLVLFRCDGFREIGLGHVSRCLALAEALAECGIACRFHGRFEAGAADLLASVSVPFDESTANTGANDDLRSTIQAIKDRNARAAVLDSYQVDDAYISTLDQEGAPLLLIDDFGRLERYDCSAVLNFTVDAGQINYPHRNQLLLLGPEYLLVRRRLRLLRRTAKQRTGPVHRLLVATGGVDRLDLSRLIVNSLLEIVPHLSIHAIVGPSYRHAEALSMLLSRFHSDSRLVTQLADLADEFAWADMCVCGGGLTKYEAAYLGVPTAVLSQTVEQAQETVQFAAKGLAFDLGIGTQANKEWLSTRLGRMLVDTGLRESLSATGLSCFPEDPTGRAATALTGMLNGRG